MKALKIFSYFYLIIALLFIYDAVDKIIRGDNNFWLSIVIAAVAIFMFFFRKKSLKKFGDNNQKK